MWTSLDKMTGETLGKGKTLSAKPLEQMVQASHKAFLHWKDSTAFDRKTLLLEAHAQLSETRSEFAMLLCREAGKPLTLAQAEIDRALFVLEYSAHEALRFSGEWIRTDVTAEQSSSGYGIIEHFPKGVILGITPFNFPLNLALHKLAPALASGNSIILKPSPHTPLVTLKILELFKNAPKGLIQVATTDLNGSAILCSHPKTAMISFTGSDKVGFELKRKNPLKDWSLELGGNAWVIVDETWPAEDLPNVAQKIARGAFGYAGQSCISIQNIAVHEKHQKKFEALFRKEVENFPFGDPLQSEVLCGPLIDKKSLQRINKIKTSHRVLFEGKSPVGTPPKGIVAPFVVKPSKELHTTEVFGPVASLSCFKDLEALLRLIENSPFALQLGLFSKDLSKIKQIFRRLEVGGLLVGEIPTVRLDHQPYGGEKQSGGGREGIRYAMENFSRVRFLKL